MRRAFIYGGLAMVAMIVFVMGSVTYVLFNIDAVIKNGIEDVGSRALKVPLTVAEAQMSLKTGEGQIVGLRIANPAGFEAGDALHAPLIQLKVDAGKPAGKAISISELVIDRPVMTLDIIDGRANWLRLRNGARAWARRAENPDEAAASGQAFVIDQVVLSNGTLILRADFLGAQKLEAPLPDTRIKDIGAADEGALPADVARIITEMLVTAAERASRRFDLEALAAKNGTTTGGLDLTELLSE